MPMELDSRNPYPGPRPFTSEEEDRFFGRDREKRELCSLIIAHREVLLYSQSGAGKTSLLNSGIIPFLVKEGFDVLPVVRVGGHLPSAIEPVRVSNVYVLNVLLGWADLQADPVSLVSCSLSQFLSGRTQLMDRQGLPCPRIAIFDQFEELFTTHSEHWKERRTFVDQVQEALQKDPMLRLLFVIREDYVTHLESCADLLPERLRTRYRLERLRQEAALLAVEKPLQNTGRSYAEGVAVTLVQELLKIRVEDQSGRIMKVPGQYVEPVQLQVVCQNLWRNLEPHDMVITSTHLERYGDVDEALKNFYEKSLQETVRRTNVKEGDLRKWFSAQLITTAGTRGIVYRGQSQTGGISNAAVDSLEDQHIIRAEVRAGSRWYELTHDRFIEPIQKANEVWTGRRRTTQFFERIVAVAVLAGMLVMVSWWFAAEAEKKAMVAQQEAMVAQQEAQRAQQIENAYDLFRKGTKLLLEGKTKESLIILEDARYTFEKFKEERALVNALIQIGQAHASNVEVRASTVKSPAAKDEFRASEDEYRLAEKAYIQALEIGTRLEEAQLQGKIFEKFASLKENIGESKNALELYERASKAYQEASDLQNEGRILEHLALLYEGQGNTSFAEEKYQEALKSFKAIRDDLGIARIIKALSVSQALSASNHAWGFLVNLHTAETYELKGETVDIGRSVRGASVLPDISFNNKYVSRHHLVIRNNYLAEDLRSTNGTTINGHPLYYATPTKLRDRDIIVLANFFALEFNVNLPTPPLVIPPQAWAIFIDNQSKSYIYLTDQDYSLAVNNGKLALGRGSIHAALMKIRNQTSPEVLDVNDEWEVLLTVKETDYRYLNLPLPDNKQWIPLEQLSVPLQYVQLSLDKKTIVKEGPTFQLIPIHEPP